MPEPKVVTCVACAGEVVPGTLFCWRHAGSPPKIGEIGVDHEQLRWSTTLLASGPIERLLAVFLDGIQVAVRRVDESTNDRPARVLLDLGDPQSSASAAVTASVSLTALLDAILRGDETVEATRIA